MLQLEFQRSMSAPRLHAEPRPGQEAVLGSRGRSATKASPRMVNGLAGEGLDIWEDHRSPNPVEDVVPQVDEISTPSGASVTEAGWDGIHGLEDVDDPVLVGERTKGEKWEGGVLPAAQPPPIRNTLRRVFVNPRK